MKKTISVLLALVLTVGLFSACSKDGKEETTTAAPAAYTLAYTYDSHYAQTDPSAVRAYEKIAKAIAEGGVAVRVNTDMMDDVNRLLYTGFPLMALVDTVSVNSDNSGVTIKYKNGADTHRQLVGAFSQKVNTILKACGKGTVSNHVYLLNVYHYVATHATYDDSVTDTYTAILQGKGMSLPSAVCLSSCCNRAGWTPGISSARTLPVIPGTLPVVPWATRCITSMWHRSCLCAKGRG